MEALKLPVERFVPVAGNHDIDRRVVRKNSYVYKGLAQELSDRDKINGFLIDITNNAQAQSAAISHLDGYLNFIDSLKNPNRTQLHPLLDIYNFEIDGKSIGITSFNSAWRASGEGEDIDRGRLVIGEYLVDLATQALGDSDFRVALLHHPFDWLLEIDRKAVEPLISASFHMVCSGHVHDEGPEARKTISGSSLILRSGCLYEKRSRPIAYHIADLDLTTNSFAVSIREFSDSPARKFNTCVRFPEIPGGIFSGEFDSLISEATDAKKVARFLALARPTINRNAYEKLMLIPNASAQVADVRELYVFPPISKLRHSDSASLKVDENAEEKNVVWTADRILSTKEDIFLFAPEEGGKTTVAHYLAVHMTYHGNVMPRVPILFDCSAKPLNPASFETAAKRQYADLLDLEQKPGKILDLPLLVLLDNFDPNLPSARKGYSQIKARFPAAKFMAFVLQDQSERRVSAQQEHFGGAIGLFIQEMPRRQVRALAHKLGEKLLAHAENFDGVYEQVIKQIEESNLPRTGYIVTLVMLAYQQGIKLDSINESTLLQSAIHVLLNRLEFLDNSRVEFDPRLKELVLAEIARYMHPRARVNHNEILIFIVDLLKAKGLKLQADAILDDLLTRGILVSDEQIISFRFGVFHQYFHAIWLMDNHAELEKAFGGINMLSLTRELLIISGLTRRSERLISETSKLLDSMATAEVKNVDYFEPGKAEFDQSVGALSEHRLRKLKATKLTKEQIDNLLDKADLDTQRRVYGPTNSATEDFDAEQQAHQDELVRNEHFMQALLLLGRLIRNSEFSDASVKEEFLHRYLHWALKFCNLAFGEIDKAVEMIKSNLPESITPTPELETVMRSTLQIVVPMSMFEFVFDTVASQKMQKIIENVSDKEAPLFAKVLLLSTLVQLGHSEAAKGLKAIIKNNKANAHLLNILFERLAMIYAMKPLLPDCMLRIESLLADIVQATGIPGDRRGQFIAQVRQKASEADNANKGST